MNKRATNLTIDPVLLDEARSLNINLSATFEASLRGRGCIRKVRCDHLCARHVVSKVLEMMNVPSVSVKCAANGSSTKSNELGMPQMQERAYEKRGEQYLLIESPLASGKSRSLYAVNHAVEKIKEGTIASFDYDPAQAKFVNRASGG